MIARRESFIVLSDNERTFEILFAILKFCINDINSFSISGLVSGDCVFIDSERFRLGVPGSASFRRYAIGSEACAEHPFENRLNLIVA